MQAKEANPADALRQRLEARGKTLKDHCKEKGVDYRAAVLLLNGFSKGRYGKSHVAAVKLGLKEAA